LRRVVDRSISRDMASMDDFVRRANSAIRDELVSEGDHAPETWPEPPEEVGDWFGRWARRTERRRAERLADALALAAERTLGGRRAEIRELLLAIALAPAPHIH